MTSTLDKKKMVGSTLLPPYYRCPLDKRLEGHRNLVFGHNGGDEGICDTLYGKRITRAVTTPTATTIKTSTTITTTLVLLLLEIKVQTRYMTGMTDCEMRLKEEIIAVHCELNSFTVAHQPNAGQGHLILEVSGSHSGTPQSVGLLWKRDRPVAEMPPAGFGAIPATDRPQTLALDHSAIED